MLCNAKNGCLALGDARMDYIRFGSGKRTLIILPGLGDGLTTVKGTALPMSLTYRLFSKDFTVYMFSRRQPLSVPCSTRDMAQDLIAAMDLLGITKADILGVSMGGMIAQHLAADHPERVSRLVLTVTCARPNPMLTGAVQQWVDMAHRGDHTSLMDSNVRLIYSGGYYRKNKWLVPVMGIITKPKSYERFLIQADACLRHNCFDRLKDISCPTLVICGGQDRVVGEVPSRELAEGIPGARLISYHQWGHGVYEEEPTFNETVLSFLLEGEGPCTV